MAKYFLFLKWWLIVNATILGSLFAYRLGFFNTLLEQDRSFLGFVTIAVFAAVSIRCGFNTRRVSKLQSAGVVLDKDEIAEFERLEDVGWFSADICMALGMLGTVVGFVMMLQQFAVLDISDPASVQKFLGELGIAMSTALLTTLVGIVCSIVLRLQYFNLGQGIDRIRGER